MNGKTARKLRKIAYNEGSHKKKVYRTYLKFAHTDKRLFLLTGITRILDLASK